MRSVHSLPPLSLFSSTVTFPCVSSQGTSHFYLILVLADDSAISDASFLMLSAPRTSQEEPFLGPNVKHNRAACFSSLRTDICTSCRTLACTNWGTVALATITAALPLGPLEEATPGPGGDGLQRPRRAKGLLQAEIVLAEAAPSGVRTSTYDKASQSIQNSCC